MSVYDIESIARIAHAANKEHSKIFSDFSHRDWEDLTEAQRESIRAGVMFRLKNLDAGPEAQHEAWFKSKQADGWVYGATKDAAKKTHPCMVPWEELPLHQQTKDVLFAAIVRGLTQK